MKVQVGWLREHVDLPEDAAAVGRTLTSLGFPLDGLEREGAEAILDLDVGSNRPDAMCHAGIARELATKLGRGLRSPRSLPEESAEPVESACAVVLDAPDLCPRYAARVVRGIRHAPSPAWMSSRLAACGIRPIDVVLDMTNYVLLEMGHPLHAFDLDRLEGRRIVVRRAREGERMATLDGVERSFVGDELLICDAARGVAVAGVMGGADSEIRPDTRDILIESAWFEPKSIRRTARRLGLHTEASHRFERGADIDVLPRALDRCAALVAELAGGTVLAGMIDAGGALPPRREIVLRRARLRLLGGVDVPVASVERILPGLGFEIAAWSESAGGEWTVRVPRGRMDVAREVDLIEEILRHHGYDSVPRTLPPLGEGARPRQPWEESLAAVRRTLVACGHHQAIHFSFDDPGVVAQWGSSIVAGGEERLLRLANPMAENQAVMRASLVPGLLRAASLALRRGESDVRLFEDGHVFFERAAASTTRAPDPHEGPAEERWALATVATGRWGAPHFRHRPPPVDVLALRGALFDALVAAGAVRDDLAVRPADVPHCAPGAADVLLAGRRIGWFGRLHPDVLRPLEIEGTAIFASEVDLSGVVASGPRPRSFAAPSRFPRMVRDLCVLVDGTSSYGAIIAAVRSFGAQSDAGAGADVPIESFELIDRYVGAGVPEGKASLTFSVAYRSGERTLLQDEVDRRHAELVELLRRMVGAVLRT